MSGFKNFILRGNLVALAVADRNQAAIERNCPECTMSIPVAARRCPECTAPIVPATEQPQPVAPAR